MPSEHRQINFSLEEVARAVAELMSQHGILPAKSKIVSVRITEEDDGLVSGVLCVAIPGSDRVRDLPLTADLLGAALINLCREARIPLPRGAKKRLVRVGESVTMHLNFRGTDMAISRSSAPVDSAAAMPAAPRSKQKLPASDPAAPRAKQHVLESDLVLPDWWANMSRRR